MTQGERQANSEPRRRVRRKPPPAGSFALPGGTASYFRDQLREARATALRNAEGFQDILFAIERLGSALTRTIGTLGSYRGALTELANESPMARDLPELRSAWHVPFSNLYHGVMVARNDALHQGAYARNLTANAIRLALVLEDALMNGSGAVRDYLVHNVTTAFPWQPISFIRQQMLENAFSTLPVYLDHGGWHIITDQVIALYLRTPRTPHEHRNILLARTLAEAMQTGQLVLDPAYLCPPDTAIEVALQDSAGRPILVTLDNAPERLAGILTPFDLM